MSATWIKGKFLIWVRHFGGGLGIWLFYEKNFLYLRLPPGQFQCYCCCIEDFWFNRFGKLQADCCIAAVRMAEKKSVSIDKDLFIARATKLYDYWVISFVSIVTADFYLFRIWLSFWTFELWFKLIFWISQRCRLWLWKAMRQFDQELYVCRINCCVRLQFFTIMLCLDWWHWCSFVKRRCFVFFGRRWRGFITILQVKRITSNWNTVFQTEIFPEYIWAISDFIFNGQDVWLKFWYKNEAEIIFRFQNLQISWALGDLGMGNLSEDFL